jgi:glucokinase
MKYQEARTIGAVDIGGTKIAVGMVDEAGTVVASDECPTDQASGFSSAVDRIERMLRGCAQRAGASIDGIGIGCTGPVDPGSGEIGETEFLKTWKGANLIEALGSRFGVRVALENDADAATLGEAFWGAGRGKARMLYVTVGTGIGVGIVLHGRLYRGVDDFHPEIGHQVIDATGPQCYCGAKGCWEVLARGPAMSEWMETHAPPEAAGPKLNAKTWNGNWSAKAICEMAATGHPLARTAVDREAHYLGLGLANLVIIFCPEIIVLGGSVMASLPLFIGGIRAEIRRNCGLVPFERTEIRLSSLGSQAAIVGAARTWHHRFVEKGECGGGQS